MAIINEKPKRVLSPDMIAAQSRLDSANVMWNLFVKIELAKPWIIEAARKKRKPKNMFIANTIQAYTGAHGIVSTYNAMHFSVGQLWRMKNPQIASNDDGSYTVRWENDIAGRLARGDDQVVAVAIINDIDDPTQQIHVPIEGLTACRADGEVTFHLPELTPPGDYAHVYLFFVSANGLLYSPDDHFMVRTTTSETLFPSSPEI